MRPDGLPWAWGLVILQGLWFQRLYGVGHEAAHGKLYPRRRRLNDAAGQLALLPIAVPVGIFRKIHKFHHGQNRRDHRTSALDTFIIPEDFDAPHDREVVRQCAAAVLASAAEARRAEARDTAARAR